MAKVSIILPLYDSSKLLRRFTMNALKCIREHTPEELYELIIVDNKTRVGHEKKEDLYTLDYGGSKELSINDEDCKIIHNDPDIGYYASMNQAAKVAEGDYVLFTQNDVMVLPGWLEKMLYYFENNLCDALCPDMMPRGYKERQKIMQGTPEDALVPGGIEAGMIMMKKSTFEKIGGWYDKLWQEIGWKLMFLSLGEHQFRLRSTLQVPIIHINQASRDGLQEEDESKYNEIMNNDHNEANAWEHHYRVRHKIKCPDFCNVCTPT